MTDIRALLATDPLAEAEQVTGKSYKDDRTTMALGFAFHQRLAEAKRIALGNAGDTHFAQSWDDAEATYQALGFEKVLSETFAGHDGDEECAAWWHPDGILLWVESYRGDSVNMARAYYNVHVTDRGNLWGATSSGSFVSDDVWAGDHDAREGLGCKLAGLREVGEFLRTWEKRPWLWLLTYMDTKAEGYDHHAINERRISALPGHVREAVQS